MAASSPRPPLSARIGDRERESAAEELTRAYVRGRLGERELERRHDAVAAAVTRLELLAALRDLPGAGPRAVLAPARDHGTAVVRRADRAAIRAHGATFAGLNGGAVAVWAATGTEGLWFAAVLVPTTLLLAAHVSVRRRVRRALASRRALATRRGR